MHERVIKQFTIAAIFFVLVGAISYGYYALHKVSPTCFDRIQNQGEEGIDCGTVCGTTCGPQIVPLQVIATQLVAVGEGDYDAVAQIRNPNTIHGVANADYDLVLKDRSGAVASTIHGSFYMMPVQTKFIVKTPIHSSAPLESAELVIKDVTWHKIEAADLAIDFPLVREQHGPVSVPGVKYQVEGTLSNKSDFNFDQIDVTVVLQDAQGVIKAVTTTTVNTFLAQSLRYFKVTWPDLPGTDLTPQVQATTNVFNNQNFLRRYGTEEQFQSYQ